MSSSEKVILVTGGTGLIGRAIKEIVEAEKKPNENWVFLGSADGDLRFLFHRNIFVNLYENILMFKSSFCSKKDDTLRIFNAHKPTHVIHLAAMVGGLFHNMAHNLDFYVRIILPIRT